MATPDVYPKLQLTTGEVLTVPIDDVDSPEAAVRLVWAMVHSSDPFWAEERKHGGAFDGRGEGFFISPHPDHVSGVSCGQFDA